MIESYNLQSFGRYLARHVPTAIFPKNLKIILKGIDSKYVAVAPHLLQKGQEGIDLLIDRIFNAALHPQNLCYESMECEDPVSFDIFSKKNACSFLFKCETKIHTIPLLKLDIPTLFRQMLSEEIAPKRVILPRQCTYLSGLTTESIDALVHAKPKLQFYLLWKTLQEQMPNPEGPFSASLKTRGELQILSINQNDQNQLLLIPSEHLIFGIEKKMIPLNDLIYQLIQKRRIILTSNTKILISLNKEALEKFNPYEPVQFFNKILASHSIRLKEFITDGTLRTQIYDDGVVLISDKELTINAYPKMLNVSLKKTLEDMINKKSLSKKITIPNQKVTFSDITPEQVKTIQEDGTLENILQQILPSDRYRCQIMPKDLDAVILENGNISFWSKEGITLELVLISS